MNKNLIERAKVIKSLQGEAAILLDLKKKHRQRRPIVIEFSGSPKSGKTTCINSLELFLKRNGFSVSIVQERASVCPVADKKSPMFNIWTACASITGMLGLLEQMDISRDVIILDRGIFDALCWFEWLSSRKALSAYHKSIIDEFLSLDLIVNRVDIVFAFKVSPDESIKREYANLLTDKPGTIMSIATLTEYLSAIKSTITSKDALFHKIIELDTTSMNQDEVGKRVTDQTLSTLKDILMERIGYIEPQKNIFDQLATHRFFPIDNNPLDEMLGEMKFALRDKVEQHSEFIQPIPIAVFTEKSHRKVLTIKKQSKVVSADSPEKGKTLLYVGGHSRTEDRTDKISGNILAICRYTLQREVKEEIGATYSFDDIVPCLIYTPDTEKSKKHIAVCFVVEINDIDEFKLRLDAEELVLNRGKSKSGSFQEIDAIVATEWRSLEPWSQEICKHILRPNTQLSIDYLFDNPS
jgi:thymidylate kinase